MPSINAEAYYIFESSMFILYPPDINRKPPEPFRLLEFIKVQFYIFRIILSCPREMTPPLLTAVLSVISDSIKETLAT